MTPKPGLFDRALLPIYEAIVDNPQATTQHMALSTLVGPEAADRAVADNAAEDDNVHDDRFFHPSVRGLTLAEAKLPAKRAFNLSTAAAGNFKVNLSQRRPPKFAFTDLLGWQKRFVRLLQNPAEHRARHLRWLHDRDGMIGKTECGKHVERAMSGLRLLNPTSQPDAMFLLAEHVRRHDRPPRVMVLDFSKSASVAAQNHEDAEHQSDYPNNAAVQHGLLEALMDATARSYKCSGMVGQLSRPHVVVFANCKPDRKQMNPTRFINCEVSTALNLDVCSDDFRAACAKIERAAADDDLIARHLPTRRQP
jgi:hypothetical protein